MKLLTEKGELTLPKDFSFEVEQNSAFFSDDGTTSVSATIPATPADMEKLGNPTRLGRSTRFVNSFPATIQQGVFQKKGILMVTSATNRSVSVAMALEDSEFYAQFKDYNLKEIFAKKVLRTYNTPKGWYNYLFMVYKGEKIDVDFTLIPVAVNKAQNEDKYQVNNEPEYIHNYPEDILPLQWQARIIQEDGEDVSVPDGYGIAPYLWLHRFIDMIFSLCGYSVRNNCFATHPHLKNLVLLHNCSDVICNGKIDYSDLVPNKTVSEILEWMNQKFHAQVAVDTVKKTVDIILLEDIMNAPADLDITKKVIGHPTLSYTKSQRIVIEPDVSIDGAAAAAATIEDLLKKYGTVKMCSETGFREILEPCLVLRLSDGCFYECHVSFFAYGNATRAAKKRMVKVGTNIFTFDRGNSESAESIAPADLVPPMVFADSYGTLMPYIGKRTHRNTSYNDSGKDEDQEIIIVDYAGLSDRQIFDGYVREAPSTDGRCFYGTTQKYTNRGNVRPGCINLVPDEIAPIFFKAYNKMLLNNTVEVSGQFNLSAEELLGYNLYRLKRFEGQTLLPSQLRYEVGKRIQCLEAKFKLMKDVADPIIDDDIVIPEPKFTWKLNRTKAQEHAAALQPKYTNTVGFEYAPSDPYTGSDKDIWMPSPSAAGQQSAPVMRTYRFFYYYSNRGQISHVAIEDVELQEWFDSVEIVS